MDKDFVNKLEKIGFDVHPALEVKEFDGWYLGFSEGYTKRANSILAGARGTVLLETKIAECEKLYKEKGLPVIFKVSDYSVEGLIPELEKQGYKAEAPSDVMMIDADSPVLQGKLESVIESEDIGVITTSKPDDTWLKCYFEFEGYTSDTTIKIATKQFEIVDKNENLTAVYCRIQNHGENVAVASIVIEDGYMFLLNVVVNPVCRGKGFGKILVKEILETACMYGAEKLCLQVVADNTVAVNLYKSFGFEYLYSYWYMIKR